MTTYIRHDAKVSNVEDPDKLGAIKVICASLLDEDEELPIWIRPEFHFVGNGGGWFGIPVKDSWVELLVPEHSRFDEVLGEQLLTGMKDIRWRCTAYDATNPLPKVFETNYPQRSGYAWPNGWAFFVDSKAGELYLAYTNGVGAPQQYFKFNKDGKCDLRFDNVNVGGDAAGEDMALGNAIFGFLNTVASGWGSTHTHVAGTLVAPTGGGPVTGVSGAPVSPMDTPVEADLVSSKHKVEK